MNQLELYEAAVQAYPDTDPVETVRMWAMLDALDAEREAQRAAGIPDPVVEEQMPPVPAEEVLPPDPDEIRRSVDKLCQMLAFFDGGDWGRLGRRIRFVLEGDMAKEPETFQYDEEPPWIDRHGRIVEQAPSVIPLQLNHGATYEGGSLGVAGGVYGNNGWTSVSGEAHGNGSLGISGGVCGIGSIGLSRQKRAAHRPPDPDLAARDAEIVQQFRKIMARVPKPLKKEAHIELGRCYHLSTSSIRNIVKGV